MNIVRVLASTLALVSAFAAVPAVAQADEGRPQPPAAVDRDRRGDHDRGGDRDRNRDARWGYDREGRWGRYDADHRRDFDRDWRGYHVGATPAAVCRFEWENGAPVERLIQIGCFVR
ncbi:MAG TPA: hypothetical protein VIF09_08530 [Polyangiaceae bacterium]|jgi:hypothetical protein